MKPNSEKYSIGVIAGNFDVIHPGYIEMFKEMKEHCYWTHVLLHTDPTIERPEKLKPILSVEERVKMLLSLKYVNEVSTYTTEKELVELILKVSPGVRFLGDDYKDKDFTGKEIPIDIHYLNRSHGWSTTKFKKMIAESINSTT